MILSHSQYWLQITPHHFRLHCPFHRLSKLGQGTPSLHLSRLPPQSSQQFQERPVWFPFPSSHRAFSWQQNPHSGRGITPLSHIKHPSNGHCLLCISGNLLSNWGWLILVFPQESTRYAGGASIPLSGCDRRVDGISDYCWDRERGLIKLAITFQAIYYLCYIEAHARVQLPTVL